MLGVRRAVDEGRSTTLVMGHWDIVARYDMLKSSLDPGIRLNERVDKTGGRERETA